MVDYAPGMRTIIRDEEWMVKKVEKNNMGNNALYCVGVSPLVKDKEAVFLTDLEEIAVVDPKDVKLVIDGSSFFRRTQLYLESQWRQQIPTDTDLHIGVVAYGVPAEKRTYRPLWAAETSEYSLYDD